jgi:seryl-tRNA synthetase
MTLKCQEEEKNLVADINKLLRKVGNIVHESVKVSKNEDESEVVSSWGEVP